MSFLNEAFPAVDQNSAKLTSALIDNWRDNMACSVQVGANLSNALKMTPYGMTAYQKACRAMKSYSPMLNINVTAILIVDPNTGLGIPDKGLTYDAGDSIIMNISTFNGPRIDGTLDRFFSWSPNEILNIVGVHEIDHLVLDSETKELSTDGIECIYCKGHKLVIGREFKARLQFSLMYPAASRGKNSWLSNYAFYFEVMHRLLHPEDDSEKLISQAFKDSRKRQKRMENFEASIEFQNFVNNILTAGVFTNGLKRLFKYYNTVIYELENRFESFASHDDALFTNLEEVRVQNIVDNMQQYLLDEEFNLIP